VSSADTSTGWAGSEELRTARERDAVRIMLCDEKSEANKEGARSLAGSRKLEEALGGGPAREAQTADGARSANRRTGPRLG